MPSGKSFISRNAASLVSPRRMRSPRCDGDVCERTRRRSGMAAACSAMDAAWGHASRSILRPHATRDVRRAPGSTCTRIDVYRNSPRECRLDVCHPANLELGCSFTTASRRTHVIAGLMSLLEGEARTRMAARARIFGTAWGRDELGQRQRRHTEQCRRDATVGATRTSGPVQLHCAQVMCCMVQLI